jgi:hypothetical protein
MIPNPSGNQNPYGAGAFNTNYRPAGSTPAHTPNWRTLTPSWRGGYLTYPYGNRYYGPAYAAPYAYYPGYYPPYGSTYYGFQPTEQEQEAAPPPQSPPQVVVFQQPAAPAPAPEPAPAPQIVVVQVPVPVPTPPPETVAPPKPEPAKPSGPPKEVFRWTDNDGVVHYSTQVPAGVKADKVGPK